MGIQNLVPISFLALHSINCYLLKENTKEYTHMYQKKQYCAIKYPDIFHWNMRGVAGSPETL